MPRGREELKEHLKRCLERVDRVPLDEPWCGIRFPRIEAKKRIRNDKHSKRVVFVVDEQAYSEWHVERERYMRACGDNPTFAYMHMLRGVQQYPVENVVIEDEADD